MSSAKSSPRFLPTLTQVVAPPALPTTLITPSTTVSDRIVLRLLPLLEAHLRESVEELVRVQLEALAQGLSAEFETILQQELAKYPAPDPSESPLRQSEEFFKGG